MSDTISGLDKREFVLRRPGKDTTEVFTTRWAMSYLRGPMTRDQISDLMATERAAAETAADTSADTSAPVPGTSDDAGPELGDDESMVMPEVADGTPVRYVDVAAPWLADVGGDERCDRLEAAVVARVRLRYDESKADLVHDEEYECVITPLGEVVDPTRAIAVDYDERDLRTEPVSDAPVYQLTAAKLKNKTFFSGVERDLKDHLYRTMSVEIPANAELKLYGRPGEDPDAFETRCLQVANERADAEIAKLRDKYEAKVLKLRDQIEAAQDRVDVLEEEADAKRNSELLSTAGSILGGLLGGRSRSRILGDLGTAAGRRGRSSAARERVEAAENKVGRLHGDLEELEAELAEDVTQIDAEWMAAAKQIDTMSVGLEKTDIQVAELVLAWLPVS